MPRSKKRIGLVGYGGYGRFLVESWKGLPGAEVVALAGRDIDRVRQTALELGVPKSYRGYEKLLADPEIEVVVIASPPATHAEIAVAAAEAGKHLFCEKPLATTLEDGERIRRAVDHAGVSFCMGFVLRYNPLFRCLKQVVCEGLLGELHRVDFTNFAGDENLPPDHWFWRLDQSGGILVEHGVHFFDIYTWLSGSPASSVTGHRTVRAGTPQEDRVLATVEHRNGMLATYYHAFDKPSRLERTSCLLGFDQGYLRVDGWIALAVEVDAVVNATQWRRLSELLPPPEQEDAATPVPADQRKARGGGRDYELDWVLRYRHALSEDKQTIYRQCVRDALTDLLQSIDNPNHTITADLASGLESLRIATAV
ncbi:MAG TPA: Gfo/Idh/MocA family oxidoreductase [Armatimonadota bacterium]|jgi:predicted dehydrogenase